MNIIINDNRFVRFDTSESSVKYIEQKCTQTMCWMLPQVFSVIKKGKFNKLFFVSESLDR